MDFITAAANLRAAVFGLKGETDPAKIKPLVEKVVVPKFTPKSGVKIETDEKKAEQAAHAANATPEDQLMGLLSELPVPSELAGFALTPQDFEKDDDSNFHMDFITAASNLRAINYSIEPADRHRVRAKKREGVHVFGVASTLLREGEHALFFSNPFFFPLVSLSTCASTVQAHRGQDYPRHCDNNGPGCRACQFGTVQGT